MNIKESSETVEKQEKTDEYEYTVVDVSNYSRHPTSYYLPRLPRIFTFFCGTSENVSI